MEGQGKPYITVETSREMSFTNVVATVEVSGLATACNNSASLASGISPTCVLPVTLDEWENLPIRDEMGRLDIVGSELLNRPDDQVLFLIGHKSKDTRRTIQQRVDRIRRHLVTRRKLAADRIHFIHSAGERRYTRIYVVPKDTVGSFKQGLGS